MSGIDQGMMPEHVQPQHAEDDTDTGEPEQDENGADIGAEGEAEPNREQRAEEPKPVGKDPHPEGRVAHSSQRMP